MKVTFLGHAAFHIEGKGASVLIDPFITYNPLAPCKVDDFMRINYILISHGHSDHLGDAIHLGKKTSATVIANAEIAGFLKHKYDLNTHAMHIGGSYNFPFGRVKLTAALHGSGIDYEGETLYGGNPHGFLLEIDGRKLYHAGDTGLTRDMELLAEEQIDLALLPIGGNFTMDIHDAAKAVRLIRPQMVVPMHYNTFPVIQADPIEFISLVNGAANVQILKPGEYIEISKIA